MFLYSLLIFFFFFSSRRRHTRLQGDWSSDVCSSDLVFASQRNNRQGSCDLRIRRQRVGASEEFIGGAQTFRGTAVKTNLGQVDKRIRLVWIEPQRCFKLRGGLARPIQTKQNRTIVVMRASGLRLKSSGDSKVTFGFLEIPCAIGDNAEISMRFSTARIVGKRTLEELSSNGGGAPIECGNTFGE